jgi:hypothetical protein
MATLIVEDGTIVANANSYVTMEEAVAYHSDMGNSAWTTASSSPDDDRITALIRGARYIDMKYLWPGTKTGEREQSLMWPREDVYDREGWLIEDNEIPIEVKRAQMEAALREVLNPGSLAPDVTASERVLREKIGPMEVQYADSGDPNSVIPSITAIDDILAPILGRKSNTQLTFVKRA